jgi:hypothetical protein
LYCIVMVWTPAPAYAGLPVDRSQVLSGLDKLRDVKSWRASTGAIFILTDTTLNDLTFQIQKMIPGIFFMLIPYYSGSANGWTDPATWAFVNHHIGVSIDGVTPAQNLLLGRPIT